MKNKTLDRCYKLAKPHLKTILLVSVISIIIDILELTKPYLVKVVIDDFLSYNISKKDFLSINMIGAIYICIVVFGNLLDYFAKMKTNIMGEEVLYTLRNKLYKYTQDASIVFHDKTPFRKARLRLMRAGAELLRPPERQGCTPPSRFRSSGSCWCSPPPDAVKGRRAHRL